MSHSITLLQDIVSLLDICIAYSHTCWPFLAFLTVSSENFPPFNGPLSGTTHVGQYQEKHSPSHTHPDHQTSFINFLQLLRSITSSLFNLRAWQSFSTTTFQILFALLILLIWNRLLHTIYISSTNHDLLFATHAHAIATCFAVTLKNKALHITCTSNWLWWRMIFIGHITFRWLLFCSGAEYIAGDSSGRPQHSTIMNDQTVHIKRINICYSHSSYQHKHQTNVPVRPPLTRLV